MADSKFKPDPDGIPVLELKAKDPQGIPLGAQNYQNITSGAKADRDEFDITYIPRMRHHRVAIKYRDKAKKTRVFYVPESIVIWESPE